MTFTSEEKALIRQALIALQEKDNAVLKGVVALGSVFDTEKIRDRLTDRIGLTQALLVRLLNDLTPTPAVLKPTRIPEPKEG